MKKILVPCDFSTPSINALRFALDIARASDGEVQLLYVIELPIMYDSIVMPVLYFEEAFFKDMKAATEARFRKLSAKFKLDGVKLSFQVQFGGTTIGILDYVKKKGIDLIVMGSHGASGLKEVVIGSNTEKIVRTSPVPVLVIKDFYKGPVKSIVFPVSFSTRDQEALTMKVKVLQSFFKAHLHLVWINTPADFVNDTITRNQLEAFAIKYRLNNYSIDVFNHTSVEEGIMQYTQMIKGNMIALGTHGRKGLGHLLLASVAEDIVNHSKALIWTSVIKEKKVKNK